MAADDHAGQREKLLWRAQAKRVEVIAVTRIDLHERHAVSHPAARACRANNSLAAANTWRGVSSSMQRWSRGHTRFWHGPHGTCLCKCTALGWCVSVQAIWVGPNSVTTGRSNAAAKWRGPLSVVTSSAARRIHALVNPMDSG